MDDDARDRLARCYAVLNAGEARLEVSAPFAASAVLALRTTSGRGRCEGLIAAVRNS